MWYLCIYQICGIYIYISNMWYYVFIKYVVFMYLSDMWYLCIYQICGIYIYISNMWCLCIYQICGIYVFMKLNLMTLL